MKRLLQSFFDFLPSVLLAGRNYETWKKENYTLQSVVLKNKKIALELEHACKKDGFLTFAEYLAIDQFGKNGYHATHTYHGMTPIFREWAKTIPALCKTYNVSHVLEVGCGDGNLAIELLREAKKNDQRLMWRGIEILPSFRKTVKERLKKSGFEKNLETLTKSLENITIKSKALAVFSYSLDSMPPEIFINTTKTNSYPNTIIGIVVKKGLLIEKLLSPQDLRAKKMSFQNGIFTHDTKKYNLSSWKLYPMQRAYIPIHSFSLLINLAKLLPLDSRILIMDELSPPSQKWDRSHLCIPKDLTAFSPNRDRKNLSNMYKETGEALLYYPFYLNSITSILSSIGFKSIEYDIEDRIVYKLRNEKWKEKPGLHARYAFFTGPKIEREKKVFSLKL